MKTIKARILELTLESCSAHLKRLKEINAPEILIEGSTLYLAELERGEIEIAGSVELLEQEYVSHEKLKGNGGKSYVCFNGTVNYFPKAKFGKYIAPVTKINS
ncbi:hypothetical protein M1M30_gp027 [Maribacter phage Colly_1]|uniref:Uncharacterized protein n=1 Tax=Maribacter phage Colly_1 TaxID=2745691 RepID=A0A8E4XXV1_9CAUD|nr:hypothetical protein M1M30_gp027 [Maribacter phage Colly_1]QQO97308.1 hypothetical protein Colly1_27 [Maribacter phage Colly_1]